MSLQKRLFKVPLPDNPNLCQVVYTSPDNDRQEELFEQMNMEQIGILTEEQKQRQEQLKTQRQIYQNVLRNPDIDENAKKRIAESLKKIEQDLEELHELEQESEASFSLFSEEEGDEPTTAPPTSAKRTLFQEPRQQQQQPPVKQAKTDNTIVELEQELDTITRTALQPLHSFMGQVAVAMGKPNAYSLYKWVDFGTTKRDFSPMEKTSLVQRGAKTLDELIQLNKHMGFEFLKLFMELHPDAWPQFQPQSSLPKEKEEEDENIGACTFQEFSRQQQQQADQPLANYLGRLIGSNQASLAPGWVWAVLPMASFQFILSYTSFGAIEMALGEIHAIEGKRDVTLKQLLCSGNVTSKFAEFVANIHMKRSGGNAYPAYLLGSDANNTNRRVYNVSAGYRHKKALHSDMIGFRIWFQDVYKTNNPEIARVEKEFQIMALPLGNPLRNLFEAYKQEMRFVLRHVE